MSRLLRTSLLRPPLFRPIARPFTSTAKRLAPRTKANCWSLDEIAPTLFQPDVKLRLAWSVAKLLQKHLNDLEEPFGPHDVLTLTADCASLFYPSQVPGTLSVQDRLNLIHTKKLLSLPRMDSYLTQTQDAPSTYITLDDIAKRICKEVSVPFTRVKKLFPEACSAAWNVESEEPEKLSLVVDEEENDKEEVGGAVAVVAYAQWMNQIEWEVQVGEESCGADEFGEREGEEIDKAFPLVRKLAE